jgi:hypothetical protein
MAQRLPDIRIHHENVGSVTMNKNTKVLTAILVSAMLFAVSAVAHHGLGEYDQTRLIRLEGRVVGFELKDPHSLLFVDVENPDGSVTSWIIEGGAAQGVVEAGLSKEFLESGPRVRVTAYQSKEMSCEPKCVASGRSFDFDKQ